MKDNLGVMIGIPRDTVMLSIPFGEYTVYLDIVKRNGHADGNITIWSGNTDVTNSMFFFDDEEDHKEIRITAHNLWAVLDIVRRNSLSERSAK